MRPRPVKNRGFATPLRPDGQPHGPRWQSDRCLSMAGKRWRNVKSAMTEMSRLFRLPIVTRWPGFAPLQLLRQWLQSSEGVKSIHRRPSLLKPQPATPHGPMQNPAVSRNSIRVRTQSLDSGCLPSTHKSDPHRKALRTHHQTVSWNWGHPVSHPVYQLILRLLHRVTAKNPSMGAPVVPEERHSGLRLQRSRPVACVTPTLTVQLARRVLPKRTARLGAMELERIRRVSK